MSRVKDPVCGMSVDSDRAAAKGVYAGEAVYFCSAHCKQAYEAKHGAAGSPGHTHAI